MVCTYLCSNLVSSKIVCLFVAHTYVCVCVMYVTAYAIFTWLSATATI